MESWKLSCDSNVNASIFPSSHESMEPPPGSLCFRAFNPSGLCPEYWHLTVGGPDVCQLSQEAWKVYL